METGIYKRKENGYAGGYVEGFKISFSGKNKFTGETLQNKGNLVFYAGFIGAILMHKERNPAFSDAWVHCKNGKIKKTVLLRCYANATIEIDGKTGRIGFYFSKISSLKTRNSQSRLMLLFQKAEKVSTRSVNSQQTAHPRRLRKFLGKVIQIAFFAQK